MNAWVPTLETAPYDGFYVDGWAGFRGDHAGGSATFSSNGLYRYSLSRSFLVGGGKGTVTFIMLNPSTADAYKSDPTIRRCELYAQKWGFDRLRVVNLFAYRSTDPRALRQVQDPEGDPLNLSAILDAASESSLIVAAWGAHGSLRGRGATIRNQLLEAGYQPRALALTVMGEPGHPLYLRGDLDPFLLLPVDR